MIHNIIQKMLVPENALRLLFLASAGVLAAALYFQYFEDLKPCNLCLYQRYPYGFVLLVGIFGITLQRFERPILTLAALAFLAGSIIAGYHTGVEQHWWENAVSCAPEFNPSNLEDLIANVQEMDYVPCDVIPWALFGISMAGYNTMLSFAMFLFTVYVVRRPQPKKRAAATRKRSKPPAKKLAKKKPRS